MEIVFEDTNNLFCQKSMQLKKFFENMYRSSPPQCYHIMAIMMTKNFSVGQDKVHGISIVCDPNLPCKALFQFGSYAKNGPKSKSFYLFAKFGTI